MDIESFKNVYSVNIRKFKFILIILVCINSAYSQTTQQKTSIGISSGRVSGLTKITKVSMGDLSGTSSGSSLRTYIGFLPNRFNQDPTDITISTTDLNERSDKGTVIGTISTTDPENNDLHNYTLVDGFGDNSFFGITGNQLLSDTIFDYENPKKSFSIRIKTDDYDGGVFEKEFNINIQDVNDPPTDILLTDNEVDENLDMGSLVGSLQSIDQDLPNDSFTYELVIGEGDTDNALFEISGDELLTNSADFNFEVKDNYSIRIQTSDSLDAVYTEIYTINIHDANDPPTDIIIPEDSLARFENDSIGTSLANLMSVDEDAVDTYSYSLVSGDSADDNAFFTILDQQLKIAETLNYEQDSVYTFRLETMDSVGATYQKSFSLIVSDINDAPDSIYLTNSNITEGRDVGTVVGKLRTIDQDNGNQDASEFIYTLVPGSGDSGNSSFFINSENQIESTVTFDFNQQSSYTIRVNVTDLNGIGLSHEEVLDIAINVEGTNSPPFGIELSQRIFTDNLDIGDVIGIFSTYDSDPDDTHTYSFIDNVNYPENESFTIFNNELKLGQEFDVSENDTIEIFIRSTDSGNESFERSLEIIVEPYIDVLSPVISLPTYLKTSQPNVDANISVNVTDDDELASVKLFFRGILSDEAFNEINLSTIDLESFSGVTPSSAFDDIGMEFYIQAIDLSGNMAESVIYRAFLQFIVEDGLELPISSISGGKTGDYRIISVPYELTEKTFERIFEIPLGNYDADKPDIWRLITYNEGQFREYKTAGFGSSIEIGRGYWFNAMESLNNLLLGVASVNTIIPYTMDLEDQWNQVGNPYNVPISWNKVIINNPDVSIESIWTYNGTWSQGDIIQPFSGGFVWSDGRNPVLVDPKITKSGRISNVVEYPISSSDIDGQAWHIPIKLVSGSETITLGGFGMHPEAHNLKDQYDRMIPPRFGNYIEWYATHEAFSYPWFRTDILPSKSSGYWEFNLETNFLNGINILNWDHDKISNSYSELLLIDKYSGKVIDMKKTGQYKINIETPRSIAIYYNSDPNSDLILSEPILGNAYPNPGRDKINIPLIIPEQLKNEKLILAVFDNQGKLIKEVLNKNLDPGFYEFLWETGELRKGVYLLRFVTETGSINPIQKKILIH